MKRFKRILLVDDDHVCNYITKEILENLNMAEGVFIASNGREALNHVLFYSKTLDIVFLDINMPVMNGFEFLNELYEKMPDWNTRFKIIILTTSTNDKDLEKLRPTPVDGLIVKPLTPEKLEEVLDLVAGKPNYIEK